MADNLQWDRMIDIMKKTVLPATGCTEPISVAFTSAVAAKHLDCPAERIEVMVSANLMKNGMGVTVPGTGKPGLYIAAAMGALDGDSEAGLQVLGSVHEDKVQEAIKMVADGLVTLSVKEVPNPLYVEVILYGGGHTVKACVVDSHTHLIYVSKDGSVLYEVPHSEGAINPDVVFLQGLKLKDVFEFATEAPLDKLSFIREAAVLNEKLSEVGMGGEYGLGIGHSMANKMDKGMVGTSLFDEVIMKTTAAADARMGGAPYAAMSNSGSGNQGICATLPVCVVAKYAKASEEELIRALALSHMTAIYIHGFLPKLSALCCSLTSGMGGAAGAAWLLTKDYDVIARVLASMVGDTTGMVCDGAANSCAMKVASATASGMRSIMLAMDGKRVTGDEGLVAHDVDESIRNIGALALGGMQETDRKILDIMIHKNQ